MKLVSVSLLIEALAARWPDVSQTPDIDVIADFITEYAADSAFDIPLKTVLAHYDAEPDLFNPKAELPLTPGQYEALYNEDSASAFNWGAVGDSRARSYIGEVSAKEQPHVKAFKAGLSPTGRLRKSQPELQDLPRSMCAGCGVSLPWGATDTHCSRCQQPPKPFIDPGHCLTTRVCVGCGRPYNTRSAKVALCFDCQEASSL